MDRPLKKNTAISDGEKLASRFFARALGFLNPHFSKSVKIIIKKNRLVPDSSIELNDYISNSCAQHVQKQFRVERRGVVNRSILKIVLVILFFPSET